jgi:hypothetical protein
MKKLLSIMMMISSIAIAQGPPPPDGGNTNAPPYQPAYREPVHLGMEWVNESEFQWHNFSNNWCDIYWKETLTSGEWEKVGEGPFYFIHNYPEGFYKVVPDNNKLYYPVVNTGTNDLSWEAEIITGDEYIDLYTSSDTVPPEFNNWYSFLVFDIHDLPPYGDDATAVVEVRGCDPVEWGQGNWDRTQRVTVVVNNYEDPIFVSCKCDDCGYFPGQWQPRTRAHFISEVHNIGGTTIGHPSVTAIVPWYNTSGGE